LALKADELRCDNLQVITWDAQGSETYKGKRISIASAREELTG